LGGGGEPGGGRFTPSQLKGGGRNGGGTAFCMRKVPPQPQGEKSLGGG